jgi:CHAT domain-containing protein
MQIKKQSDKLALGELASKVYEDAINLSITMNNSELAFYFSEKNKSSVLLEALAGQEAQRFAGIPDNLLQKENDLKSKLAFLNQQLANPQNLDSMVVVDFTSRRFYANQSYDSLIRVFETNYPEYFTLKYSTKTASVADIQEIIDNKTAMISYTVSDSLIHIFIITKNNIDIQQVNTPVSFADSIAFFRNTLTLPNSSRFNQFYKQLAFRYYQLLFPKNLPQEIENLVIIPDNVLASVPFEALLTQAANSAQTFSDLPYLVKKFNISYSYSATLFHKTFPKQNTQNIEITQLEDWLAFAPVASDDNIGISQVSRALNETLTTLTTDTLQTRSVHHFFSSLPGTKDEIETILNYYESKNLHAEIHINKNANETFIKSGILEKYKIIHFATHGLVNSQKPDLSCILLAREDSTSTEDGILYSGEIFNLKINADLVVLSACETGLGEIKKGEGIIGLTRALLYAGTRNIVVSLWKVSDNSTAELMISFYQNIINQQSNNYAYSLRNAKMKMIQSQNYAHPFYWSPFILVGK